MMDRRAFIGTAVVSALMLMDWLENISIDDAVAKVLEALAEEGIRYQRP